MYSICHDTDTDGEEAAGAGAAESGGSPACRKLIITAPGEFIQI